MKTYYIKIENGYFTLATYKINAFSYAEALEIAKKKWLENLEFSEINEEEYIKDHEENDYYEDEKED